MLFKFASFVDVCLINEFTPKYIKKSPPNNFNQYACVSKKVEIAVKPNPATAPYTESAVAAPIPVIKPEIRPSVNVRFIVNKPIGPTGAATEKPIIKPLVK